VTATSKGKTAKESGDTYASVWDALADTPEQAANLRARAELMRQIAEVVKNSGSTPRLVAGSRSRGSMTCCAGACRASRSMHW